MGYERLYQLLQPETPDTPARVFRGVHHAMVAAGIAIMLADTVAEWRLAWAGTLDGGFQIVCGFFFVEYMLRLTAAPGAPGAGQRGKWRSRLAWAASIGGICDFVGSLPASSISCSRRAMPASSALSGYSSWCGMHRASSASSG